MPITVRLPDPMDDAWLLFRLTYNSVEKCQDDLFNKLGLTYQQYVIMGAIKHMKTPATPSGIATWIDRNPNTVTLILDRMEKNGLVQRKIYAKDRRKLRLTLTRKGEELHNSATMPSRGLTKKVLSVLTAEELSLFAVLLRKIQDSTFECRNIKDKVINDTYSD